MRILGVDYGTKRVGLAYADELLVAMPLPAAVQATDEERVAHLLKFVKERRVQELVVGLPYNMDGTIGFKAKEAQAFAEKLRQLTGLPVHLSDETLTSYAAEQSISKKDRRDVRASGVVDSRAAAVILQEYLDEKWPPLPLNPDALPKE